MKRIPRSASIERDKREQIVHAAMERMAAHGVSGTSLRVVAADCGVSLGLVQHYFSSKAALVSAVDEYVLAQLAEVLGTTPECVRVRPPDEVARHFAERLARRPKVMNYVARALCDGEPIGATIFDRLVEVSAVHTHGHTEPTTGTVNPDPLWTKLNPLILTLGTIMFRGHIERNLRRSLDDGEGTARRPVAYRSIPTA